MCLVCPSLQQNTFVNLSSFHFILHQSTDLCTNSQQHVLGMGSSNIGEWYSGSGGRGGSDEGGEVVFVHLKLIDILTNNRNDSRKYFCMSSSDYEGV